MAHRNEPKLGDRAKGDALPASEEAWALADRIVKMLGEQGDPMVIFQALELAVASFALKMPSRPPL